MTTKLILAASALATLLAVPAAHADTAQRPAGPRLQAILDRAMRSPGTEFPGVALYVRRPGETWSGAAGKARLAPARRMRPGDRFRAGSIAKTYVAATTLRLVEEGRFALDDPLPGVLPASVTARFPHADRITVRMLLNHTSGLPEFNDERFHADVAANPLRRWADAEFLDRAAALPPVAAPGERFAYSNANYTLLGLIIERATGKSWRAAVRERVLKPLRLTQTTLPEPGARPRGRDIAHGYEPVGGTLLDLTDVDSSMAGASGGHALLTTNRDLARFLRGLLAGKLFDKRETLKAMRTWVPGDGADGRVGYGLGMERYVLPGGVEVIGHMGTTAGYRAFMFHLPAQNVDLAMITTSPSDPSPVLMPALKLLAG
jgi:D-alanyl-D-alanine carboxypeptidase